MGKLASDADVARLRKQLDELSAALSDKDRDAGATARALRELRSALLSDEEALNTAQSMIYSWLVYLNNRMRTVESLANSYLRKAVFDVYIEFPQKSTLQQIHGGINILDTGHVLQTGSPLVISKGTGRLFIVVQSATTPFGDVTVSGTSVDRETGEETASDSEVIQMEGVSTDASTTDAEGNDVFDLEGVYGTAKWWTGTVTLTAGTFKGTIDTYHISFDQFNDAQIINLSSFDINCYTSTAAAWGYWYLYKIIRRGGKLDIKLVTSLEIANGDAIADRYWRLRRGNLDEVLDGRSEGIFIDMILGPVGQTRFRDVTIKVFADVLPANAAEIVVPPEPFALPGIPGTPLPDFTDGGDGP